MITYWIQTCTILLSFDSMLFHLVLSILWSTILYHIFLFFFCFKDMQFKYLISQWVASAEWFQYTLSKDFFFTFCLAIGEIFTLHKFLKIFPTLIPTSFFSFHPQKSCYWCKFWCEFCQLLIRVEGKDCHTWDTTHIQYRHCPQ